MPSWLLVDRHIANALRTVDGVAPFVIPVALVMAVGIVLLDSRRRTVAALAGVTLVGVALRLAFARELLLGMSNYEREPALILWMARHGVPLFGMLRDGLDRFQVTACFNLALSGAWPLLAYAFGRTAFRSERVALLAAGLLAVCPHPIYYARSDVLMIASAMMGATTLMFLQRALDAHNVVEEAFFGFAALALFDQTLLARQESFLFGGAFVVPMVLVLFSDRPRRGLKALWCVLLGAMALRHFQAMISSQAGGQGSFIAQIFAVARQSHGPPLVERLFARNGYLFWPWAFPLAYLLLALAGVVVLRRRKGALAYLLAWGVVFALGHVIVPAWDLTASARYALHSLMPCLFLGAFGLDALLDRWRDWAPGPRWVRPAAAAAATVLVAGTTAWSLALFRLPASDIQQEYSFLRGLAARGIPARGSLVVESYGDPRRNFDQAGFFALRGRARFAYFGLRVRGDDRVQEIQTSDQLRPWSGPVYLYLGLPCLWMRPDPAQALSETCRAALASGRWVPVASARITGPRHDNANGRSAAGGDVTLYRLATP